jgi:broad specificity phosphatase PhoE
LATKVLSAVVAVLLVASNCSPARAAGLHDITLTLVRHAESTSNAAGIIDTSTPGPELTSRGWCQATQAAGVLSTYGYDGVYASSMTRTQQTATPTAQALGKSIDVLPGLREVEAGQFEGQPVAAVAAYMAGPTSWVHGERGVRIPDSLDGNEFEARFDAAVQHIYDSGHTRPVAFSHSVAIATWALMNAHHPDVSWLTDRQLPNLGRVVMTGNPTTGWTITEWDTAPPPC